MVIDIFFDKEYNLFETAPRNGSEVQILRDPVAVFGKAPFKTTDRRLGRERSAV